MRRFGMSSILYGTGVVVALVGITACNSQDKPKSVAPTPQVGTGTRGGTPLHHWLEDEELRNLMAEIQAAQPRKVSEASGSAAEMPAEVHRYYASAAESAKRLAIAAKRIPVVVENINMSEEDREAFNEQAAELRNAARMFAIVARHRNKEKMQEQMDKVQASCISCHSRFRDVAGELAPPRA